MKIWAQRFALSPCWYPLAYRHRVTTGRGMSWNIKNEAVCDILVGKTYTHMFLTTLFSIAGVTLSLKCSIFWDITPCSLVEVHRLFGWTYCFHLQGRNGSQATYQQEACAKQRRVGLMYEDGYELWNWSDGVICHGLGAIPTFTWKNLRKVRKISIMTSGLQAEIQTWYLPQYKEGVLLLRQNVQFVVKFSIIRI
jgi:hypothetical protein